MKTLHKVKDEERAKIAPLFEGIWDSMVISYLQGYQGEGYVDRFPNPQFGIIVSGEYSFPGGNPDAEGAWEMIAHVFDYIEGNEITFIYSPDKLGWRDMILECHRDKAEEVMRYWIVQKDYDFDEDLLEGYISKLPSGFEIVPFDEEMYNQAMSSEWSREFCETFENAADYLNKGFGFGIMDSGQLVSGISTMTVYDGGAEIQIATREDYRRRGLALPCAARFILEAKARGIRPCWDAENKISRHIALKLGYEYNGEYSTVHMCRE